MNVMKVNDPLIWLILFILSEFFCEFSSWRPSCLGGSTYHNQFWSFKDFR